MLRGDSKKNSLCHLLSGYLFFAIWFLGILNQKTGSSDLSKTLLTCDLAFWSNKHKFCLSHRAVSGAGQDKDELDVQQPNKENQWRSKGRVRRLAVTEEYVTRSLQMSSPKEEPGVLQKLVCHSLAF